MNENIEEVILRVSLDTGDAESDLKLLKELMDQVVNDDSGSKTFAELEERAERIEELLKLMQSHGLAGTAEFSKLNDKLHEIANTAATIDQTVGRMTDRTFADLHTATGQAKSEMQLLEEAIHDALGQDINNRTFEQLINDQRTLNELIREMKKAGLDNTEQFGQLQNRLEEIRNTARQVSDNFGWASSSTFNDLSTRMDTAVRSTHQIGEGVSIMNTQAGNATEGMGRLHNSMEWLDRTTTLPIAGAMGEFTDLIGFSTQAMSEFSQMNAQAERAQQQAARAQELLNRAVEAGEDTTVLATRAQEANTAATEASSAAAKGFRSALISIGIGVFLLLLSQLIENWEQVEKVISKVSSRKRQLAEVNKEAIKDASAEISQLKYLYAVSTDVTKSKEQRLAATKKLQDQYPSYFKNISTEQIMLGQSVYQYNQLTKAIIASSRAKAAQNRLQQEMADVLDKEYDNNKRIKELQEEQVKLQGMLDKGEASANLFSLGNVRARMKSNQGEIDVLTKENKRRLNEAEKDSKFLIDMIADNEKASEKYNADKSAPKAASSPKAAKDNSKLEELKRQREEAMKIQQEANKQFELSFFGEMEKELIANKEKYDKEKAMLDKFHLDATDLTTNYEANKQKIYDEYEQKRIEADKERQKQYDEAARAELERVKELEAQKAQLRVDIAEDNANNEDEVTKQTNKQIANIDAIEEAKINHELTLFEAEKIRFQDQKDQLALLEEQHQFRLNQITEDASKQRTEIKKREKQAMASILGETGKLFSTLGDQMEEGTTQQKALAIAGATIDTIQSGVATYKSFLSALPAPYNIIAGGIAAAGVVVNGFNQVKKIAAVKVGSKGAGGVSTPNLSFDQANFSAPTVSAAQANGTGDVRVTNPEDVIVKTYILDSDLDDAERRKNFMDSLSGF